MKTSRDSYSQGIVELAGDYSKELNKRGDRFMEGIVRYDSVCNILNSLYQVLLKEKLCKPLHELPAGDKAELWEEVKKHFASADEVLTKDKGIAVAKAIYALGTFIEKVEKEVDNG